MKEHGGIRQVHVVVKGGIHRRVGRGMLESEE